MRCQRVWTAEKDAVLAQRYRDGAALEDIAEGLGTSVDAARTRIRKLRSQGVDLPSRVATHAHPPEVKKRALAMIAAGRQRREVSRQLGVSETSIADWTARERADDTRQIRAGQKGAETVRAASVGITLPKAPWEGRA